MASLDALLKHFSDQGFTPDLLAQLSDSDLADLPGPDDRPLSEVQLNELKLSIEAQIKKQPTRQRTRVKIAEVEAENKAMREYLEMHSGAKEECDELQANAEHRKKRISDVFSQFRHLTSLSVQEVRRMVSQLRTIGSDLDICFCIDGTGSMTACINSVKQCIVKVALSVATSTGMKVRFGVVVYRDIGDGEDRFMVQDFTTSGAVEEFLSSIEPKGGDDGPEDCFGGLWRAASEVTWKALTRVVIWMGDAPQHGKQYNGGWGDNYPEGDPDGLTAAKIFGEMQRKHIMLVFGKLKNYTDAMISRLQHEVVPFGANLLQVFDVSGDMSGFLSGTLHATTMQTKGFGKSVKGRQKPYQLRKISWVPDANWSSTELAEVIRLNAFCKGEQHPLMDLVFDGADVETRDVTCQLSFNPVDKGEMRFAYYAIITEMKKAGGVSRYRAVAKESVYEGVQNSREEFINQAYIQAIAVFLGMAFTSELIKLSHDNRVLYIPSEIIRFPQRPGGRDYFSLEPFLEGEYVKFNGNDGYINHKLEVRHSIIQTFSHFTYSYSRGMLIVVDAQGVCNNNVYKLTDPAIHTSFFESHLQDPTNFGKEGISAFFSTHKCNPLCKKLKLKTPENVNPMEPFDRWNPNEFTEYSTDMVYPPLPNLPNGSLR